MVHISDGVLPAWMLAAGFALTAVLLYFSLREVRAEEIPRISLITAALFVASLVHFPVGPTSVHLLMNGLAGIMLGRRAFAGVFVALALQAVFFQHGGLTALGVNTLNMGLSALLAWQIFERRRGFDSPIREYLFGGLAGGIAVLTAAMMLSAELLAIGEGFREISIMILAAHLPIVLVESLVTGAAAGFLVKTRPDMLMMKKALPILILALVLSSGLAAGHRMFVGQRATVDLYAIFDDGEPAASASVQVYRDGVLYAENKTDSTGRFTMVLPGTGSGDWRFLVSGGGHEEDISMSIRSESSTKLAAGLTLIAVPAALAWRRRIRR